MSRLTRGQQALIARQKVGATSPATITYTRGSDGATVDLTGKAWYGRTMFRRNAREPHGGAVVFSDRDYMIPVADLATGGTKFQPADGDQISETTDGVTLLFELMSVPGEPPWRHSDPGKTLYRVHTKEQQQA